MAYSESPFSSTSSSYRRRWKYDVFLSFRGEDTRKQFIDHLYSALIQVGIHTFRGDNLPTGEEISPQLLRAIEGSRISVVVFSRNYASSRWFLDELVKIIECRQTIHQVVLPIFYDTDPSDIRKQTGSYAKAFDEHEEHFKEEMEKVNRWREALTQAANLSGYGLKNDTNGHEAEFIKRVVNDIACKLGNKTLHVAKHPVGISSRVQGVISLLKGARNNVGIVGIHGIAGIGKTTIAKAVFNDLYFGFEGSSFLSGVKEISDKPNGLVELQERLLHDILKPNVWKINNVYEGMNLIKKQLHRKNVLVVFDDVDKREQLEALMGERCWFGDGSKIIVVTKNKQLLTEVEVDGMYHAMELDRDESLQLFSLHAFRETRPAKDYKELSEKVVDYCEGLPLALKILGSHLFGKDKNVWEIDIAHWQNIPHDDIQGKLRVSFDALDVDLSEIFLDIACFFVGQDKDYVANIVGARYDCHPDVAFRALIGRSLIAIDTENRLWMHGIVRKMGREIIRQRSLNHPGNCSRIVLPKDAHTVLSKEMGTEAVEGLALDGQGSFSTKSFTKMRRLQLLQITGAHLVGSYSLLPRELIWLCWLECSLKSLPSDFHLSELVILDMQGSKVQELWKGTKILNKLKILNLSYSKCLVKTPNFLGLPSLERLILVDCTSLVEVHQSIGNSKSLVLLNLEGCNSLKTLPESTGSLKSLQTLNVAECSQLEKLPDSLDGLESLTELFVKGTAIKQLPTSARYLKKLTKLSLVGCKNVPHDDIQGKLAARKSGKITLHVDKHQGQERKRIEMARLKSGWTDAISASEQEQNNVDMAQQREPVFTEEFERANDLIGGGIELPPDTPDDKDQLKKSKGSKSRDMVDVLKSGFTGAVSASAREQNTVDMAQQREPLLTRECEQAIDLTGGGIELPRDAPDELKKGSKFRDMIDYLKSGWTLLMTNLILEIASAVFDQLGYAFVGMVLAFVALLLATAELIYMERMAFVALLLSTAERMNLLPSFLLPRKERTSLLPSFHRQSASTFTPGKPVGTIVEYFGLVGAVWQCFYSTVEYAYTRQKKDNPIKMCLLPFIFLSCVAISKLIKTEFIDDSA